MFRSAFQLESALLRCVAAGYGSWFLCGVWRLALVHGFCVVCGGWLAVVRGVCEVCGGWLWFVVSVRAAQLLSTLCQRPFPLPFPAFAPLSTSS